MTDADLDALLRTLDSFSLAYPEDMFGPVTPEEIEQHSSLITRNSAAMGRHCATFMANAATAIRELSQDNERLREAIRELSQDNERLREALRKWTQRKPDVGSPHCYQCGWGWSEGAPEAHAPGCLAAIDAAKGG